MRSFLFPCARFTAAVKEEKDDNKCLCVQCVPVCVCCRKRERETGGRDVRRAETEKENTTANEMRFVISSVHPGPLSRAASYCRQSSPWRHLKTQTDGKLWCISNMAVIQT